MNLLTLSLSAIFATTLPALADTMSLYNWGFNVAGAIIDKANTPGPLPPLINTSAFNLSEGLGTLTIAVAGLGPHYVDLYFDNDLNPAQFATDYGAAIGTPAAGESWGIGTGAEGGGTQLFSAFLANSYNDTDNSPEPGDIATGLAFSFVNTSANQLGVVTVSISTVAPSSGFYIEQWNTYSGTTPSEIYISGSEVSAPTPEPATALLLLLPLSILAVRLGHTHRE
jgi:hypothetical protein